VARQAERWEGPAYDRGCCSARNARCSSLCARSSSPVATASPSRTTLPSTDWRPATGMRVECTSWGSDAWLEWTWTAECLASPVRSHLRALLLKRAQRLSIEATREGGGANRRGRRPPPGCCL